MQLRARLVMQVQREIEIQTHLRHHNIARMFSYFKSETHLHMLLEYVTEGDLYSVLRKEKKFSEAKTAR